MPDSKYSYCMNGHSVGAFNERKRARSSDQIMERQSQYGREIPPDSCTKCGAAIISVCQNCHARISMGGMRPERCGGCGKPFPWTATIKAAKDYTDQIQVLSTPEKTDLKECLTNLTKDTPGTPLEASKFMMYVKKIDSPTGDALLKIMINVATEGAKILMERSQSEIDSHEP
jgi:hypothetical protein